MTQNIHALLKLKFVFPALKICENIKKENEKTKKMKVESEIPHLDEYNHKKTNVNTYPQTHKQAHAVTMERTTNEWICQQIILIALMTTVYFTNHQKQNLIDYLKKYPGIIM